MNAQMIEARTLSTLDSASSLKHPYFDFLRPAAEANSQVAASSEKRAHVILPSLVEWYRILRAHHHWTMFQAIRFALWLGR